MARDERLITAVDMAKYLSKQKVISWQDLQKWLDSYLEEFTHAKEPERAALEREWREYSGTIAYINWLEDRLIEARKAKG